MNASDVVRAYILENEHGMKAVVTNYGAKVVGLIVKAPDGCPVNVIAGFEKELQIATDQFDITIGHSLSWDLDWNNKRQNVSVAEDWENNQNNPFIIKLGEVCWSVEQLKTDHIIFTHQSSMRHETDYASINVKKDFLLASNGLQVTCSASADRHCMIDLNNEILFNLNGGGKILNHRIKINAVNYFLSNKSKLESINVESVRQTPFDFTRGIAIGARINDHHKQLQYGQGYRHFFILNPRSNKSPVARVQGDKSGILMNVHMVGDILYFNSGNNLGRQPLSRQNAFLLMPACKHLSESFPCIPLEASKPYHSFVQYSFFKI